MSELISIITPVYNLENLISETIESILNQTISHWEWIIVDDGSTDNTIEVIKSYKDERIKIIDQGVNCANLSILRNIGVKLAKGEILAFLDGDDIYDARMIEKSFAFQINHPNVSFWHTGVQLYYEETEEIAIKKIKSNLTSEILPANEALQNILLGNFITISASFVKKEAFNIVHGFDENYKYCEDIDLWIRLLASGYDLGYIPLPLLTYRIRENSLYHSKTLNYLENNFQVYKKFRMKFPNKFSTFKREIHLFYASNYSRISQVKLMNNESGSIMAMLNAISYYPLSPHLWYRLLLTIFFKHKLINS